MANLNKGKLMWRNFAKILVFTVLAGFWQGCISSGNDFPSRLDWIQKERTKKDDVALVLGKPYAVGNSNGTPTWTYAFYKYSLFNKTAYKELRFYWSEESDVVKSYTFTSSFPEDLHTTKAK